MVALRRSASCFPLHHQLATQFFLLISVVIVISFAGGCCLHQVKAEGVSGSCSFVPCNSRHIAKKHTRSGDLLGHLQPPSPFLCRAQFHPNLQTMSESKNNENDYDGYLGQDEVLEPLRMDDGGSNNHATKVDVDVDVGEKKEDNDDGSEDNNPRQGRPGIVVFSGGTAFNSASAEMASRNVYYMDRDNDAISRTNSVGSEEQALSRSNSLVDLMAMGSMDSMAMNNKSNQGSNNNNNNIAGGTKVWHVLPVTDDGGSTAEIVRVLGGPAVGDIRSRLLRLAPGTTREERAVRRLLGHRLVSMQSLKKTDGSDEREVTPGLVSKLAREEWLDILDGGLESYQHSSSLDEDDNNHQHQSYEHPLWKGVSAPYRSIIRAYLVHFHNQVLVQHNGVRQSQSNPPFDFTGGSIGNFFFAGARTFFGSLPAAIFLFSKVAGIPSGSRVLPAVLTEERLVLGAALKDGTRIRGQYNISHPKPKPQPQSAESSGSTSSFGRHREVVKSSLDVLHSSPISRMAYLIHDPTWMKRHAKELKNAPQWSDRHEIRPDPNPLVLDAISNANCIVYGCGSLFTSVLPSLVLDGVGTSISLRKVPKILLLNGWHDSETSWVENKGAVNRMDATSFVEAIVDALDQGQEEDDDSIDICKGQRSLVTDYITHILYPVGTEVNIDNESLNKLCIERGQQSNHQHASIQVMGIQSIPANECSEGTRSGGQSNHRVFDTRSLVDALLDLAINNR